MAWAGVTLFAGCLSFLLCVAVSATGFELEFLSEPSSRLVKVTDGRVVFRCEVSPSAAEIIWLWNGQLLTANRYIKISKNKLTVHLGKQDKNFKFPYSSENGFFQCEIRYKGKALISSPAELIFAVLNPFPMHEDIHLHILRNNTALIPCSPPYSMPNVITEFLFKNKTIDKTQGRYLLLSSGNLQIFETDSSDSGEYTCVAYNPYLLERKQASHKVILNVIEPTKMTPPLFTSTLSPKTTTVLGSNLTLECTAMGYPIPSITWQLKKDGKLSHLRHQQIAGNLLLLTVHRADEGTYSCIAESNSGSSVIQSTTVEIQETPHIAKSPENQVVHEGTTVTVSCAGRGHPRPEISWFHNGRPLNHDRTVKGRDSEITLHNVISKDAGFYQCFAKNNVGTVYVTSFLRIITGNKSSEVDYNLGDDYDDYDFASMNPPKFHHRKEAHVPTSNHHSKHHNAPSGSSIHNGDSGLIRKFHRKKKKHKGVKLVPPSRPEVTRLTDTSVMVRWNVPRNDGLPISFFKLQYREIGKRSHNWITVDEDIAAHIHSYAVTDLRNGGRYRFRVAAVYSNNDNKLTPNSAKFTLHKDSPMKKPGAGPYITKAEAASPSAITLFWDYEENDSIHVEGFFIYYRNAHSAGDYLKVTVLGANTRSHIISHLLPNTGYDIKMQSFNMAGTSEFSNIYTSKTNPSENMEQYDQNSKAHQANDEVAHVSVTEPVSSKDSNKNIVLNIVIGVISAAMLIALTVFGMVYIKQRIKRPRSDINGHNASIKPCNGHTTTNGYIPVDKINISINPLSELDMNVGNKPDQRDGIVSNNNEVIHLQTFNTNENPQLEPLLTQGMRESAAGEIVEEKDGTVILPGNIESCPEGPRSI